MKADDLLREQLLALLRGGNAHMPYNQAVADFPIDQINTKPPNVPYTCWHLLEHLRIAQWDILEFIRNPDHASPDWPEGFWPDPDSEADQGRWQGTIEAFQSDQRALEQIVEDPNTDLLADLPHAKGYNILREILVVADHNAYHIGELGILRQVMGTW
jgi:hypothetical protein